MSCGEIEIEYDGETKDYYVIWEPPVAIGSGKTKSKALLDLQQAARCGVDTVIELKFKDINK